jgi:hypothetical protein
MAGRGSFLSRRAVIVGSILFKDGRALYLSLAMDHPLEGKVYQDDRVMSPRLLEIGACKSQAVGALSSL